MALAMIMRRLQRGEAHGELAVATAGSSIVEKS
jgi:hypothetical protein